ncbi:hypothetical protein BJ875DRAFT_529132 [Amylocarpus encephaloides]|uniref:Ankyrin n=1 Tax=Amylocarpus encephaloides TaxID=45428 RepID=A0A9P7YKU8_9HELO|nr:hypothetical protein BJ875DRAFT_529132 [Amylocarpus encephaloides]
MNSPGASSATLSIHSDEGLAREGNDFITISEAGVTNDSHEKLFMPPECYLRPASENSLSPSMMAARNPDDRILKVVLEDGFRLYNTYLREGRHSPIFDSDSDDWLEDDDRYIQCQPSEYSCHALRSNGRSNVGVTTPMMEAIRAGITANVKGLLKEGANPAGIPFHVMENYAALFLRFRPSIDSLRDGSRDIATRSMFLRNMDLPQISSLTSEEVEDREVDGIAPFWCEENFTEVCFWHHGDAMHSLVEAAKSENIEIFDILLEAEADCSFWTNPQFYVPSPPTESSLCLSTPLHAAIESKNVAMLSHLLDLGFDPNTMALSNPTRSVTPLMAIILQPSDFDETLFKILSARSNINFELRTPIFGVHLLHFAVAKLDLSMLERVVHHTPLNNAGTTALGHTLLHIACMPSKVCQIQRDSRIIMQSIHETRDTCSFNDLNVLSPTRESRFQISSSEQELRNQEEVIRFLWESGIRDLRSKDIHGNTALHYLACYRVPNHDLLAWWFNQEFFVSDYWETSLNNYGHTPSDLDIAAANVRDNEGPWVDKIDNFDRSWSERRASRKQNIWDGILHPLRRRYDVFLDMS